MEAGRFPADMSHPFLQHRMEPEKNLQMTVDLPKRDYTCRPSLCCPWPL